MKHKIKLHFLQSLFHVFSFFADKSGGWKMFVKLKLVIGSLIISSTIFAQQNTTTKQETKQNKSISKQKAKHKTRHVKKHKEEKQTIDYPHVSCYVCDLVAPQILPRVEPTPPEEASPIYDVVQIQPTFPGGMNALYDYLNKNIIYPPSAREAGVEGKVIVGYVVGKDGRISDVQILRGLEQFCDEEAVKLVKNMPAWTPGKQADKSVRVRMTLPIVFKLDQ